MKFDGKGTVEDDLRPFRPTACEPHRKAHSLIATLTNRLMQSVLTRTDRFVPMLHANFPQLTLATDKLLETSCGGPSMCPDRGRLKPMWKANMVVPRLRRRSRAHWKLARRVNACSTHENVSGLPGCWSRDIYWNGLDHSEKDIIF